MVFHKALPFARLTLGKPLTHGYAQSLVATSHSWNATQNLQNRFQKQPVGHNAPPTTGLYASTSKQTKDTNNDSLSDYFKEYQKHKRLGKDWSQYQFARRIEWQPHTLAAENVSEVIEERSREDVQSHSQSSVEPSSPQDSAVSGVKHDGGEEALAKLDENLTEQIQPLEAETAANVTLDHVIATSPESIAYTEQLVNLAAIQQYAEIPAVFESMLNNGITPTTAAYNALLAAAIHLPRQNSAAIEKALNVYADMLQRQVLPDNTTYSMLITKLASHSLSVLATQTALENKRARYGGSENDGIFLFKSSLAEAKSLAQDDSLSMALSLFDSACSIYPNGPFPERFFHVLISACAEHGRIPEMVNIYSSMAVQGITPRAETFVQMLPGFARIGDIDNSVEMYNEYKKLAISNNNGQVDLVRKDMDVYAAMVRSFVIVNDETTANEFVDKLDASSPSKEYFINLQDTVGLKGFLPEWLKNAEFEKALTYINGNLSSVAKDVGFAAVCIKSADHNNDAIATQAYKSLSDHADLSEPAVAMSALHLRAGNLARAEEYWTIAENATPKMEFLEMATMHAIALVGVGQANLAFHRLKSTHDRVRERYGAEPEVLRRIDESIEVLVDYVRGQGIILPSAGSMQLLSAMMENHGAIPSVASHLLAGFGPEDINQLTLSDLQTLMQIQAIVLVDGAAMDIASNARFAHVLDVLVASGVEPAPQTKEAIEKALAVLDRPELFSRWNSRHATQPSFVQTPFSPYVGTPVTPVSSTFDDSVDPYFATTDNKGSIIITDILEKTHGNSSNQFNEALTRFKNMRRAGRHPRFFTYAKLITAAAKDNRLALAQEILALARQDVPYLAQYRIVRFGWVSILDAMVAACLQCGQRSAAHQFHQELLSIGASPSSNTFGIYITTLKESTKTFDEATEAVKIFHQAKAEGVEPTSFLYNALIGKLGKARRIDDCLFYFQEMRALGIRPTSVTYGTIVNALCRVSDERFAEELFEEMEAMPNYKPRPAPYHSMMQLFLTTKRDRSKVLEYYERMRARGISPTAHTFKLLVDAHASIEPIDMKAAEAVLDQIKTSGMRPDAVHFASLIHASGCVAHDMPASRALFDKVLSDRSIRPQPCLYQALFESMVANHAIHDSVPVVANMKARGVDMTPYIANALIHGWAMEGDIAQAEQIFGQVSRDKREPSTYEAMARAYVLADMKDRAMGVVNEALARGYPAAVAGKIVDLVGGNKSADSA